MQPVAQAAGAIKVTMDEAKEQLDALFEAALRGEEVIITHGKAQFTLVPREAANGGDPEPKSGFGSLRGTFKMSPDFNEPLEDFKEYME